MSTGREEGHENGHESRFEDWLPSYALGALEGEELEALEAHLETGCPRCAALLAGWEADLAAVAAQAPAVEPSDVTRSRLLKTVTAEVKEGSPATRLPSPGVSPTAAPVPPPHAPPQRSALAAWALAASIAAVAFSLGALWSQLRVSGDLESLVAERTRVEGELERVRTELSRARTELTGLRTHVERLTVSVQTLGGGGRTFVLAGLEGAPDAGGAAFVDPRTGRAVFHAYGLPPAPPDKTYQLWWIAEGRPVSAGVFDVDETGSGSLEIEAPPAETIDQWAVTVEPAGGVSQPTGAMVLRG